MIKIDNLTKIYKSKKKNNHKALDNINLTLPNSGLVFIIGKSGSGKSTFLNLLGGLDNTTSGSIIVDGNEITKFNESELSHYRNNHIGFIFQDYHLLDELTVYENIVLSLNLNKLEDTGLVLNALDKVGLSGYENRYPQELSGGERQRVAIARAIVKKPYLILADEPTGNLDNVTATSIVELLKELSKECLILIVSHNTIDTYKYADRIIKLANGNIISDESRNPEYLNNVSYVDDVMYYPMDLTLSADDINVLNDRLEKNHVRKIVGKSDKYIITNSNQSEERNITTNKKNLSIKNIFKLCLTFLKSKVFRITASSFMIAVIMVILALSQTIITFDSGEIIKNEMDKMNQTSLFMKKYCSDDLNNKYDRTFIDEITQEDINKFKDTGYKGNIYEVLNLSLPLNTTSNSAGISKPYFVDSVFIQESLGLMIVDEEYLISKFGSLEYLSRLDNFYEGGVIITDYLADSILATQSKVGARCYDDLLGEYLYNHTTLRFNRGYINGIIKTGYKDKYEDLLNELSPNSKINMNDMYNNKDFINLTTEIYSSLGFTYTFNKNFKDDFNKLDEFRSVWHYTLVVDGVEYVKVSAPQIWKGEWYGKPLLGNDVIMNYEDYNLIFGTNYNDSNLNTFIPHEITVEQYRYSDVDKKNKLMSEKLNIISIANKSFSTFMVSDEVFDKFSKNMIYTTGLYFDQNNNLNEVIDVANNLNYEQTLYIVEGIHTMTKAVDVFIPIFELVAIVLCVGIVFILISFSTKMVKDKMHDIGILKALGCKNSTIGIVFGLQLLLIAIFTIILSTIGYFFFIDLANNVLIESLKVLAPSHIILDLDFLTFKLNIVCINSILVMILTVISFVIPMLKIYRIKPVKIIKTKE